jgi:hypothetical protein
MHHHLVFNNQRQRPHTLLYNNMYPLKTSVVAPNLYPTLTTNPKNPFNPNTHQNSLDINHNLATSKEYSPRSAQSNRKADFSMSGGARALGARVPVLLREAVVAMVDILGVVVADTGTMNASQLRVASLRLAKGAALEVKEVVETVA